MKFLSPVVIALTCALASSPRLSAQQGQWASAGFMESARIANLQLRLANGKAISIGGADNSGNVLASAEIYTAPKWGPTGSMTDARESFAGVVLMNGKVLVTGGATTGGTLLASSELYDPAAGIWSPAAPLSVARYGHTATLLANGDVLVTGGCATFGCGTLTGVSELYNPSTNTWTTTGPLTVARYGHTAVKLKNGKVLVVGGNSVSNTSCELYNPASGMWTAAASTTVGRFQHTTTLLQDGKVLVAGGGSGRSATTSAELYDPVANTWTVTGSMTNVHYAHTAVLLGDDTVLISGGEGQSISCGKDCSGLIPTSKSEIYNETTGTFKATTPLKRALAYHSTTLLSTGRALTSGGEGYTATCCVVVPDAEFYTPLTLTFSATSLNFGLLQLGLTTPAQTVTITNVSGHTSTFSGISSSGDFAQTTTCPVVTALAAGASCTVSITFTPTAAGNRTGAITFKDNDPGSPTQTIALTGTGETLAVSFSPGSLNLGSIAVGGSGTLSATLTNDGSSSVNLAGFAIAPSNGTFTQTNNCPSSLGVQQTCSVQIVFTPPDVFTYKGTLSVTNSAGAAATLKLSGAGVDGSGGL